jgi:L-ascorbate metabolism protein UlaG (beta-lactamase superfamily)
MKKVMLTAALSLVAVFIFAQGKTSTMPSVQLVRNATLILQYAGHKILVDPMLSPKGAIESWAGIAKNPTVDLKLPISAITDGTELILVSHTHADHFDEPAGRLLPKTIKLINQPADRDFFQQKGFSGAETLEQKTIWKNIGIERVNGEHGSGKVLEMMGKTSGFVLSAKNQPTIYIMGDAIWTEQIRKNIDRIKPDFIIVNSGGARIQGFEQLPIIMDEEQTMELIAASGKSKVIAVHMDALDHCRTTRVSLRKKADELGVAKDKLIILEDAALFDLSK